MSYTEPSKTDYTMLKALENGYNLAGKFRLSDREEVLIRQAQMVRKTISKLEETLNFDISNILHDLKQYFPKIPENTLDFIDGFEANNYSNNGEVSSWLLKTREWHKYKRIFIDKNNPKNELESSIMKNHMEQNDLSFEELDEILIVYELDEEGNTKFAEPNIVHRAYERFINYLFYDGDLGFTDRIGNHVLGLNAGLLEMFLDDAIKFNDAADHNIDMLRTLKNKEKIDDSYVFMIEINEGLPVVMPLEQLGATQLKYFNSLSEDKRERERKKLTKLLEEIAGNKSRGMFA